MMINLKFLPLLLLWLSVDALAADDFNNPERWRKNSSGTMSVAWDDTQNALKFTSVFKPGTDYWAYPELAVGPLSPAVKYLTFDVKMTQREAEAKYQCALVMFGSKDGNIPWTPSPQWQHVTIDLKAKGIDPAAVKIIRIGANPKSTELTFWLRNIRFLEQLPEESGIKTAEIITAQAPATVFTETEPLKFKIKQPISGLNCNVSDFRNRSVAAAEIAANGEFIIPPLPCGYYKITLQAPGQTFYGFRSFCVVADPAGRDSRPDCPYSMDTALNVVGTVHAYAPGNPREGIRFFVRLAQLAGVNYARERIHHNGIEKSPDAYDWTRYDLAPDLFAQAHIRLSASCHDFAPWAKSSTSAKLPQKLLTVYEFCQKLAGHYRGKINVWEFWNEPELAGFCAEGPWEFAAMSKAAYLGFKAGDPSIPITNGAFCVAPVASDQYAKAALQNDLVEYFDLFNFHIYGPLNTYAGNIDDWKAELKKYGVANMPLWVTENGTNAEGVALEKNADNTNKALSADQEMIWAEFVPKAQILLQSLGVERTFTFVLPQVHERKGEKDWGMLRRDYSAKPAFAAFAAMTKALGPARYLGQPDLGSGTRAFLFARDDGAQTLVFWSESELDRAGDTAAGYTPDNDYPRTFALPTSGNAVLADLFGTPQTVTPREGQLRLTATRYPTYLTGTFQISVKTPPAAVGTTGARQSKIDKSIVLRVIPSTDFTLNGGRTALLLKAGAPDRKIKLEVTNLSNDVKSGELTAAGIAVSGLPAKLTLNPFEVKVVEIELPPGLPMRLHELIFGGTFSDRAISKLVLPVVPLGLVSDAPILAGSIDPAKWRANSSGKMNIAWDEKEQAVRFDVDFAPNIDRWVYPEFVPQGGFPANAAGLSFEIKSNQSKEQTALSLVMLVKEAGKGADSLNYTPSYGNWQDNFIELASHSPETIRLFRIGANPRQNHLTFWVRNVRLHLIE